MHLTLLIPTKRIEVRGDKNRTKPQDHYTNKNEVSPFPNLCSYDPPSRSTLDSLDPRTNSHQTIQRPLLSRWRSACSDPIAPPG
jgi:hypothetical protein